jgi:beta-lactam-binding protein with PASTA domain
MKAFFRFVLVALVLLVVAMVSAVVTMSFAIHGGEVTVPQLVGLGTSEAEHAVAGLGLNVLVERQYYSQDTPEGRIMTQVPAAGTKVRRGYQVRVAQSLGPQRTALPDVLGESERAADLNVRRRGLDIGSLAYLPIQGVAADQVLAQSPPPNASGIWTPRISLLVASSPLSQTFVMPSFVGQALGTANQTLLDAGFHVGSVTMAASPAEAATAAGALASTPQQPSPASIVVSQYPVSGQRVNTGATVNFEVR